MLQKDRLVAVLEFVHHLYSACEILWVIFYGYEYEGGRDKIRVLGDDHYVSIKLPIFQQVANALKICGWTS